MKPCTKRPAEKANRVSAHAAAAVPVVFPGPRCEDGTQVANPEREELPSMNHPQPFVREAGAGPGVVCLRSNASSSAQWRGLMERLAPAFRVFAPDSYGSGKSPDWPSPRAITLADEVALVDPGRVFALALYEPTLFSLVEAQGPAPNDADAAARSFIDYWMDEGSWERTRKPASRPSPRPSPTCAAGPMR
jgi:hypothetical protein